ncbi:polymer-forming cytoskeletal protein [Fodinibius sp.]|uniref:bactofilin family protein n=1 Tax=Fodinibius sp. TaxID=1872440 RepID=UPI002ACEF601|nr:polymer-forming cytoskeletal protein [Fodinibius sp.]MDZ7659802.1 polymer-forming cytoskeletal protein [Fodinibius sp.]
MSSNKSGKNLPSVNMISEGTELKGTLKTKNDVRIAGTLDGEAEAEGKIIVSSTGKVKGNIEAVDADIAGNIDGEVRVTNKLILRKSATIEGDIYTKTILAEEGSQINGSFHMSENIKEEIKKNTNGLSSKLGSSKSKDDKSEDDVAKGKSKVNKKD